MTKIIGKVAVKVFPDTSGFRRATQALLSKEEDRLDPLDIELDVDEYESGKNVKRAKRKQQDRLDNDPFKIDLDVDTSGFPKYINKALRGLAGKIDRLQVDIDLGGLDDLRQHMANLDDLKIQIETDEASLARQRKILAGLEKQADKVSEALWKTPNDQSLILLRQNLDKLRRSAAQGITLRINGIDLLRRELQEADKAARAVDLDDKYLRQLDSANAKLQRMTSGLAELDRTNLKSFGTISRNLDKAAQGGGRFADSMGRAFGRGSRNNLLNMTGGLVRLGSSVIPGVFRAAGTLTKGVGLMGDAFQVARASGIGRFGAVLKGAQAGMRGLAVSARAGWAGLAAFAAVAVLSVEAITTLPAGIGLAVGALTSLASALIYATAGALLPMIPAAIALGGGVAVAALALSQMDEAGGAAAKAMAGLKKSFKGLQDDIDVAARSMAPALERLGTTVMEGVGGLVRRYGKAIGNVMDDLNSKLNDPRMKKFFTQWGDALPRIFQSLGKAINSFGVGLVAFFAPVLPYAQKLANWLKQIADRFADWASSAKGQTAIKDFMADAWGAAKKLGSSLGNILSGLSEIVAIAFDSGGGKGFLNWLENITERFDKWANSAKGKSDIKKFFDDVKASMIKVKDILGEVWSAFKKLNTDENREKFKDFLGVVNKLAGSLEGLVGFLEGASAAFHLLGSALLGLPEALGKIFTKAREFVTGDIFDLTKLHETAGKLVDALIPGDTDWGKLWTHLRTMGGLFLKNFTGGVFEAIGKVGDFLGKILSALFGGDEAQLTAAGTGGSGGVAGQKGRETGESFITSLWNGLTSRIGEVIAWITQLPIRFVTALSGGGLQFFTKGGEWITGLWNGAIEKVGLVVAWLVQLPTTLAQSLTGGGTLFQGKGRELITGLQNGIMFAAQLPLLAMQGVWNLLKGIVPPSFIEKGKSVVRTLKSGIVALQNDPKGAMQSAINLVKGIIPPPLLEKGRALMKSIKSGIDSMKSVGKVAAQGALNLVKGIIPPSLRDKGTKLMTTLREGVNSLKDAARRASQDALTLVKSVVPPSLRDKGTKLMKSIKDGINALKSDPKRAGQAALNLLRSMSVPNLSSIGRSAMQGIVNGIGSMAGALRSKAASVVAGIKGTLQSVLKINSPSKVMIPLGVGVGEGLVVGMGNSKPLVDRTAQSLGEQMIKSVDTPRNAFHNIGKSMAVAVADGISDGSRDMRKAMVKATADIDARVPSGMTFRAESYAARSMLAESSGGAGAVGSAPQAVEGMIELRGSQAWLRASLDKNATAVTTAAENGRRRLRR